jgi:ABC-type transporter Mla subunit MlaD
VALDRDSIVRRDFPTSRRGYDPSAVEAHLAALAGEVEALQRRASSPSSLSDQAGEQVRAIVDAAERSAAGIRENANAEAAQRIANVTEAAERLRGRVEEMEQDVTRVMSELRDEATRLRDDLDGLRAESARLGAATEPAPPDRPASAPAPNGDAAAARIVALDMALSGKPRDETDRFIAENYDLDDREALLDEVYAAAGG